MKRASPFDKPNQKIPKIKFELDWKNHGNLVKSLAPMIYLNGPSVSSSTKIASFDLDGTIITTKSGKTFPVDENDWTLLNDKVQRKIKSLADDGFKIVIFTNQAGMEKGKTKPEKLKTKIMNVMQTLGVACQVFIATGENIYRKPCINMWEFMANSCNDNKSIDMETSFYCGDAAGRPKGWAPGRKKDFSCSDRKFAANIGLKFLTPEELFNGAKPYIKFEWGSINPKTILEKAKKSGDYEDLASKDTEMIINVGFPASGKSTLSKRYLQSKGYVIVNRDILGTQEKCSKITNESLQNKKSVVIDNTNPSKEARKPYLDIAKKHKVPVRCFLFDIPIELANHMNMYRQSQSQGEKRRVPAIAYNMYKSKFNQPELSEGFTDIKKIEFRPKFDSSKDEELFAKWT